MKPKFVLFLLLFSVVLGGYFFWFDSEQRRSEIGKQSKEVEVFTDFSESEFSKMKVIKKDEPEITLEKEGSNWKIIYSEEESYPVVSSYIDSFILAVEETNKGEIVSENDSKYGSFDLTEEKAVLVKLVNAEDKVINEFYIGKSGPTYPSQYIRIKGDDRVLLVSKALKTVADRGQAGWRDKTVLKLDRNKVKEMTFSFKNNYRIYTYTLGLNENNWEVTAPYKLPADQYLADRLFGAAGNLITEDFASKEDLNRLEELGLVEGKEFLKVKFLLEAEEENSQEEVVLLVGAETEEGGYFAKVSGKEMVYKIGSDINIFTKQDLERLKSKE